MKYEILKDLMINLDEFEKKNKKANMIDFILWMNDKLSLSQHTSEKIRKKNIDKERIQSEKRNIESNISRLILNLFKYAKHYSKKVLDDSLLISMDDFAFLATLLWKTSYTKTELINSNLYDKPAGTEIIKRLEKNGFVKESKIQVDKRSVSIEITLKGRKTLDEIFGGMNKLALLISGNLSNEEKITLLILLNKLNDYHQEKYNHPNFKQQGIDELLKIT
jgi:MarR family transcriptional regulator, lower aerobic nicotinate degradation pathway regulator